MLFINSLMLAGLAALSIPVIIHLLRSRRYEQVELGTIRFLHQALKKRSSWQKFHKLFLLLLRMIVVVLIVMVFCRPYFEQKSDVIEDDEKVLVLVNGSGSMRAEALGITQFELARDKVEALTERLGEGNELTLAVFGDTVLSTEPHELSQIIPAGRADMNRMNEWAVQRLNSWGNVKKRVYIYTDFQADDLKDVAPQSWPADVNVTVVPSPLSDWNHSITSVHNLAHYKDKKGVLELRFKTFGQVPKGEKVTVRLQFEGHKEIVKNIHAASKKVRFEWIPKQSGIVTGTLRVEAHDSYKSDNTLHFALPIQQEEKVLLVEGSPGATRYDDETFYIEKALSVAGKDKHSGFEVTVSDTIASLDDYSVVALCNVQHLDSSEVEQLDTYLNRGGSLIYFLGDATSHSLCNMLNERGLFAGSISQAATPVPRPVMNWDDTHSAFKVFGHEDRGDLGRVVFKEAFKIQPDSDSQVLVSLLGGGAAILEKKHANGRLMVVTNPCDREWGNWPAERIYLPVMREIFGYLARLGENKLKVDEHFLQLSDNREAGFDHEASTVMRHDPQESTIAVIDEASWREALGILPELESETVTTVRVEPEQSARKGELWWYLLIAAVVILCIENFIADRSTI